jgi:class 3 adenylate cyclase
MSPTISDRLFGNPRTVAMEHRVLNGALLLTAVSQPLLALQNILVPKAYLVAGIQLAYMFVWGWLYWLNRFRERGRTLAVIMVMLCQVLIHALTWGDGGGLNGPGLLILVLMPLMPVLFMAGLSRLAWIGGSFLFAYSQIAYWGTHMELARPHASPLHRVVDLSVSFTIVAGFLVILLAVVFRAFTAERHKSQTLLLNLLPESIAVRLQREPDEVVADSYDAVTVIFADMVGFTPLSERVPPADMIAILNEIFSAFDRLGAKHGLEKIRTIGDAWMAVAGCPEPHDDHASAVARVALGIRDIMADYRERTGHDVRVRIGINSGPVVAGIVGENKYHYDVWGDCVNTAARMESHGLPGRIQVTEETAALLRGEFLLEERGPVEVKGKGKLRTWWVEGRR